MVVRKMSDIGFIRRWASYFLRANGLDGSVQELFLYDSLVSLLRSRTSGNWQI
jgi:hypothetical protein